MSKLSPVSLLWAAAMLWAAQQPLSESPGTRTFRVRCASCHGSDARGGERAPGILNRPHSKSELRDIVNRGLPERGMPALRLAPAEMESIVEFVAALPVVPPRGPNAAGDAKGPSFADIVNPKAGAWPTYNGRIGGNRHSALSQIDLRNADSLSPRWMFPVPTTQKLQVTPLVFDGIMYITAVNEAFALDARNGRSLWHYSRPRTPGLAGDAAGGINRGVALLNDRVFMVTDNARLIALDRKTGELLWDIEMADSKQNYGATSAPLVVNDLVISGVSGGDEGVRGFLAAYKASTGERVWRFWTVPKPGEPMAETWGGHAIEHGCAATWLTGTYDPDSQLLFWTTGNPCPDYNGDERRGDNLYSDSVLALEPATGKLRWHYQFTPHDLHDWDAQQTPMLVTTRHRGIDRKLLLQASRNGFFYAIDRTDGKVLLAEPFVRNLTWAKAIGPDGRPQLIAGAEPTIEGVKACPAVEGATNWMSTAYNPATGFFYVMALEKCDIYTKGPALWEPGKSYYGGDTRKVPGEDGKKYLRAINIQTGKIVWEIPQEGRANTWGGVVSTAGGVVLFGDDSGAFTAADAKTGRVLWRFPMNQTWKASPMTYMVEGRQYVAVAAGSHIVAFGLTDR